MNIKPKCSFLLLAVGLALFPILAHAQSMCIPENITVEQVKGQVYFSYKGKRRPLEGVTVEVTKRNNIKQVIANTITGADGQFQLKGLKPGTYWLVARHEAAIGIEARLRISATHNSSRSRNVQIVFVLGADPSKSCGGGDVKINKQKY